MTRMGIAEYSKIVEGTINLPPWIDPNPFDGYFEDDDDSKIASLLRDGRLEIRGSDLWKTWDDRRGTLPEPKLAEREDDRGYRTIRITLEGDSLSSMSHRVIYTYFYGPIPLGMQINHKNGIKNDNRIRNLEAVWPKENLTHASDTGITIGNRSDSHVKGVLTDVDVADIILSSRVDGVPSSDLAKLYEVSVTQITRVLNGTRHPLSFGVYQLLADRTANKSMTDEKRLMVALLGLTGEAGEVADLIKKSYGHGHPFDIEKVKKELSDVMWYLAEVCTVLGICMDDVAWLNVEKLKKRYPEGFSAHRSQNRHPEDD